MHRNRVEACIEVLGDVLSREQVTRGEVIALLYNTYRKYNLNPLRGKAGSALLYDKELITLYIIGKYGLGVIDENTELAKKVFDIETKLDYMCRKLLTSLDSEAVNEALDEVEKLDDDTFFRLLRFCFTLQILGFLSEEKFLDMLRKIYSRQKLRSKVRRFTKFYIAYKIAEMIARGQIKHKKEKNLWKNILAANTGIEKTVPEDLQIAIIASKIFNIPMNTLEKIFPNITSKVKVSEVIKGETSQ